jgi:hypothetical protein
MRGRGRGAGIRAFAEMGVYFRNTPATPRPSRPTPPDLVRTHSARSAHISPASPHPHTHPHPLKPGNLLKVTEGEHAGKLCLLDFGLVAEVPPADREAMVSATIHLANRDWPSLIDDFVALDFLPANCDRGVIIPVMDRVLSPYLRGGGAKSFNFQVCGGGVRRSEGGRVRRNEAGAARARSLSGFYCCSARNRRAVMPG